MKVFIVLIVSLCCLVVGFNAAAVEHVVAEMPKDLSQNATTETLLPTNEGKNWFDFIFHFNIPYVYNENKINFCYLQTASSQKKQDAVLPSFIVLHMMLKNAIA